MISSCRISPHCSKPLFEVTTVEACSWRRLTSWKNRMAPLRVTGR